MRKIAIIQPTHLGDLMCSVPLYRALRRGWPDAEIIFAGSASTKPFFDRFGVYLDRFVMVDEWATSQAELLAGKLAAESLDLVIPLGFCPPASFWDGTPGADLRPSAVAVTFEDDDGLRAVAEDLLVRLARRVGARCAAGLADRGIGQGRSLAIPISYWQPVPVMLLELARALGVPSDDISLEFPLTETDHAEAGAVLVGMSGPGPLIGVHPGAAHPGFRWSFDRFAAVADLLASRYGARILVTGTEQEAPLAAEVVRAMRHQGQVVNLCGQTSLGCFAALVDRMDLLISNDTGAAHVARARGRPAIVICGYEVEACQWVNWGESAPRCVTPADGMAERCIVEALLDIPVDAVVAAAEALLTAGSSGT